MGTFITVSGDECAHSSLIMAMTSFTSPALGRRRSPFMIAANYPSGRREITAIMKSGVVCPFFDDDFSPGDEFSAYIAAKSPAGEIST